MKALVILFILSTACVICQTPSAPAHRPKNHAKASPSPTPSTSPESSQLTPADAGTAAGSVIVVIIVIVVGIAAYWVPTVVASVRHHNDRLAIIMVNLFAGWTAIGWVIALVWACTGNVQQRSRGQVAG